MTQYQTILKLLKENKWVSLADALSSNPPIYRISERIREIKKNGYEIESRRKQGKSYQEYHLISEPKSWDNLLTDVSPKEVPEAPAQLSHRPEHERANMSMREDSREKVDQRNWSREEVSQQNLGL